MSNSCTDRKHPSPESTYLSILSAKCTRTGSTQLSRPKSVLAKKKKKKSRRDLKDTSVHVKLILVEKKGVLKLLTPDQGVQAARRQGVCKNACVHSAGERTSRHNNKKKNNTNEPNQRAATKQREGEQRTA